MSFVTMPSRALPDGRPVGTTTIAGCQVALYAPPLQFMMPGSWLCLTGLRSVLGPGDYPVIQGGSGLVTVRAEGREVVIASPPACAAAASLACHAGAITEEIEAAIRVAVGED